MSVSGLSTARKYEDADRDGTHDANEAGIEGWTVYLDDNVNGVWDSGERRTVTDANGDYSFTDLSFGSTSVVAGLPTAITTAPQPPVANDDKLRWHRTNDADCHRGPGVLANDTSAAGTTATAVWRAARSMVR